jgi:hypothetical protein
MSVHVTADRPTMPLGVAWLTQVVPSFAVATSTPTPFPEDKAVAVVPTPQQSPTFGHDTADRAVTPLGKLLVLQWRPPSAVAITDGPVDACGSPAAQHLIAVGQETLSRSVIPLGTVAAVHLAPPSAVSTIAAWSAPF